MKDGQLNFMAQELLWKLRVADSYSAESGELPEAAESLVATFRILGLTDEGIRDVLTEIDSKF